MARRFEQGPISFDVFMDVALYHEPGGFYTGAGSAGRKGADFITSPGVGPLFGTLLGRWLDRQWIEAGRPDHLDVVEMGAGPGTLARSVLAGEPECLPALRYSAVERSAAQRAQHPEAVRSMAELPDNASNVVVVANEVFDNVAFDLLERTAQGWALSLIHI